MGDKTQLATVALGARFESAGPVTVGTTLGMLVADGLVVFGGAHLTRVVSPTLLRRAAAGLFLVSDSSPSPARSPTGRAGFIHSYPQGLPFPRLPTCWG